MCQICGRLFNFWPILCHVQKSAFWAHCVYAEHRMGPEFRTIVRIRTILLYRYYFSSILMWQLWFLLKWTKIHSPPRSQINWVTPTTRWIIYPLSNDQLIRNSWFLSLPPSSAKCPSLRPYPWEELSKDSSVRKLMPFLCESTEKSTTLMILNCFVGT